MKKMLNENEVHNLSSIEMKMLFSLEHKALAIKWWTKFIFCVLDIYFFIAKKIKCIVLNVKIH